MLTHKPLLDINALPAAPMIAVIRLDNIGDHVLGSGIFQGIKRFFPKSQLTLFTSECSQDLYEHCSFIDRCVVWPSDNKYWGHFDIVINPRFSEDYYQAGELAVSLGAPIRIAFDQFNESNNRFYTHLVTAADSLHVAEYTNILFQALFGTETRLYPVVWYGNADEKNAKIKLRNAGWNGSDNLLVHAPGASTQYRTWPLQHIAELINRLYDTHQIKPVLVGSKSQAEQWGELDQRICKTKYINLCGLLSLPELSACLKLSKLFVGADSGPKHMAAATGIPVIELGHAPDNWRSMARGWTSGECWGPYNTQSESLWPTSLIDPKYKPTSFPPFSAFTVAEVYEGKSIASITPARVLSSVARFWGTADVQ